MRKFFTALCLTVLTSTSALAGKYALIVGISKYRCAPLPGVEIDVRKMRKFLKKNGFSVKVISDRDATYNNILRALGSYEKLSKDDTFVFYYSGHGTNVADTTGDESDGKDEAIITYDSVIACNLFDTDKLIIDDEIWEFLKKIRAKKVVIFDSCHSGTGYRSLSGLTGQNGLINKTLPSPKGATDRGIKVTARESVEGKGEMLFIAAARDNERAADSTDGGILTNALLDTIREYPDIKISSLERKLETLVKLHSPQTPVVEYNPVSLGNKSFMEFISSSSSSTASYQSASSSSTSSQVSSNSLQETLDSMLSNSILVTSDKRVYKIGDEVNITVKGQNENAKGYLYILYVDKDSYTVLLPNKYANTRRFDLYGKTIRIPEDIGGFALQASDPPGETSVYVIVSETPIRGSISLKGKNIRFDSFERNSSREMEFARSLRGLSAVPIVGKVTFEVRR